MEKYPFKCTLFLIFLLLLGAAKPERYVKDNVFHSSYPKLQVKVDPKLEYLGKLDYTVEQKPPDNLEWVTYETKSHVFANAIDNQLKKAVYIQIRREQTKYVGNLLGEEKTNLRSGICDLGGIEYRCFTRVIFLSRDEPLAKFISEKGYNLPACVLARTFSRVDISRGNYLIVITYLENSSDSGLSCESWQPANQLTKEHQRYIEKFDRNTKASFNVVKKGYERPGIKGVLEREGIFE